MIVYELKVWEKNIHQDYPSLEMAMAIGEGYSNAEIITWSEHDNLPHALPPRVRNSCALRVWHGKEWKMVNIF